jgi:hypothetical protein
MAKLSCRRIFVSLRLFILAIFNNNPLALMGSNTQLSEKTFPNSFLADVINHVLLKYLCFLFVRSVCVRYENFTSTGAVPVFCIDISQISSCDITISDGIMELLNLVKSIDYKLLVKKQQVNPMHTFDQFDCSATCSDDQIKIEIFGIEKYSSMLLYSMYIC